MRLLENTPRQRARAPHLLHRAVPTMFRLTPLLLLVASGEGGPLPTEPPSAVFQDLFVASVAGFYPQAEGVPESVLPYPDQFYLMPVSVGTPGNIYAHSS